MAAVLGRAWLCVLTLSSAALAGQHQTATREDAAAHVVDPEQAPSIGSVFREVPSDLWRFVSVDTALVLTVGGFAAGVAHHGYDELVSELEVNVRLNNAFEPGSKYGTVMILTRRCA